MNQKTLISLVILALILSGLYFGGTLSSRPSEISSEKKLFAGVDGEKISKVLLEQGGEKLELELKDNIWQVPARFGYQADSSKIRALLLKIFDLSVSQKIPADAQTFEKLGVDDEAVKKGKAKVSMLDSGGQLIAGLRLGESRKSKDKSPMSAMSGQFVRREGEQEVYLLGSPISLTFGPANWLDLNLLNVLPGSVHSVKQFNKTSSGNEEVFELVRTGSFDSTGLAKFTLRDEVPAGKTIQEAIVGQIRSGLENLRLSDVAVELPDLKFDRLTLFKTTSGLVYAVESAQSGDKHYVKVSANFDSDLAEELKKEHERKSAASSSEAASSAQVSSTPAASSPAPEAKKEELKLSNSDEATKLNTQFSKWIYEIPAYTGRRFRYTKTEIIEPPAPPPTGQAAAEVPEQLSQN